MGVLLKNNVAGYLATAINASDTGILLGSGEGAAFPQPAGVDYFYVTLATPNGTQEIVKCTSRIGDALTVVRGQENTTAQSFPAGSLAEMRITAQAVYDVAGASGAASISIVDAGGYYSSNNVEGALQEAAQAVTTQYVAGYTGGAPRSVSAVLNDSVNVKNFGALGNDSADDSIPIQRAINTGKTVFFPKGTYRCNVYIGNSILVGEGTTSTIIKPYNTAIAAVTVVVSPPYWASHKEIRNIAFYGQGTRQGVGVAFGITNITDIDFAAGNTSNNPGNAPGTYGAPYIQYAQSMKFYGCYFNNLHKGVTWEAGNIGSEMFACSASNCNYGFYMLNNKGGGDGMQSGCKYFFGGEISSCDVGVYSHNSNIINGQISFYGTIFEYDQVAVYSYSSGGMVSPIIIQNCWQEGNGTYMQVYQGKPATIDIDNYTGSATTLVKSVQAVPRKTFIFDGDDMDYVVETTFAGDIAVLGTNTRVYITKSRVETSAGCSGGGITVANPDTSQVHISNSAGGCGVNVGSSAAGVIFENLDLVRTISPFQASGFVWPVAHRAHLAPSGMSPRRAVAETFASAPIGTSGTASITGSLVADGVIYPQCNEYTRNPMAFGEYFAPTGCSFTTTAGYYVCTVDVKVVSGGVRLSLWDRDANQWFIEAQGAVGKWVTFGAIGYSTGGQTIYLDMGNDVGNCVWRISAFQVVRFDTKWEAIDYLDSRSYCAP
jgi:hypothetical protein